MADIDVVRKRTSVWPWVIGLLLLALVIWAVLAMMGPADEAPMTTPVTLLELPLSSAGLAGAA